MNLHSKICIITGATSGIGRETAIEFSRMGAILILPVRNLSQGEELKAMIIKETGNNQIDIMECDLASFRSIRSFVTVFLEKYSELHILVNNAGVLETKHKKSVDGIEMTFAVNYLAHFLLTNLLLNVMRKSAPGRIVNVSSMVHMLGRINFNDPDLNKNWSGFKAYSQSKLAQLLFTRKLVGILSGDNITVNSLHPGVVSTRLYNKYPNILVKIFSWFMISPVKGAKTTIYLASSPEVDNISGEYFVNRKVSRISGKAKSKIDADRLWDVSLEMTGLNKSSYEKKSV